MLYVTNWTYRSGKESVLIPELLKYGVKPDDLGKATGEQLELLTRQLHGVHGVNKGGILRNYFKDVGSDEVALIGHSDDDLRKTGDQTQFRWLKESNSYRLDWISEVYKLHAYCIINQDNFKDEIDVEQLEFVSNKPQTNQAPFDFFS